jgi:hypothetical protein
MHLTKQVLGKYWDGGSGRPFNPFREKESASEDTDPMSAKNLYFEHDCPTNLAMLDVWSKYFCHKTL